MSITLVEAFDVPTWLSIVVKINLFSGFKGPINRWSFIVPKGDALFLLSLFVYEILLIIIWIYLFWSLLDIFYVDNFVFFLNQQFLHVLFLFLHQKNLVLVFWLKQFFKDLFLGLLVYGISIIVIFVWRHIILNWAK